MSIKKKKKTESTLLKSNKFHLPGKKALWQEEDLEVVLLDATETEIERPKKREFGASARFETEKIDRSDTTPGRKRDTASRSKLS